MRNVLDQYTRRENRLTHALVASLGRDRTLLGPFLRWTGVASPLPVGGLWLVEQQVPDELVSGSEGDGERRGLLPRPWRSW